MSDSDSVVETEVTSVGIMFFGLCQTSLINDDLDEFKGMSLEKILDSISKYMFDRSGWTMNAAMRLELVMAPYQHWQLPCKYAPT